MVTTNDRDFFSVRGMAVRHSTARRDWVCGECGSPLTTRWFMDCPNWRTVCTNDPGHDPDQFVHKQSWAYMEHRRLTEKAQAKDVFDHLPAELQETILKGDERCRSRD